MHNRSYFYQRAAWVNTYLLFGFFALAWASCSSEDPPPEVSNIEVDPMFIHFDSLVFNFQSDQTIEDFRQLQSKHPKFTSLYFHRILGLPQQGDSLTYAKVVDIVNAAPIRALQDSINGQFKDLSAIKSDFRQAFQYYQYYFPDFSVPDVYFCFTEFAVGTFLFEREEGQDAIGLSLDMFLGPDFPYDLLAPQKTSFSQYLIRTFTPEHMIRKSMEVLLSDKMEGRRDDRLIDYMVDRGRTLYLIKKLVPQMPDSILFEYTAEQLEWCRENELAMWAHILDKELLYERKMRLINTLVSPAPTTMGMPPESPGRTADFLGYQLIDQYVRKTGVPVSELISYRDPQDILKQSRYKGQNIQ
jgi:hypothetical protein